MKLAEKNEKIENLENDIDKIEENLLIEQRKAERLENEVSQLRSRESLGLQEADPAELQEKEKQLKDLKKHIENSRQILQEKQKERDKLRSSLKGQQLEELKKAYKPVFEEAWKHLEAYLELREEAEQLREKAKAKIGQNQTQHKLPFLPGFNFDIKIYRRKIIANNDFLEIE